MSGGMGWTIFLVAKIRNNIVQVANSICSTLGVKLPNKCPSNSKGTRGVRNFVSKRLIQKASLK